MEPPEAPPRKETSRHSHPFTRPGKLARQNKTPTAIKHDQRPTATHQNSTRPLTPITAHYGTCYHDSKATSTVTHTTQQHYLHQLTDTPTPPANHNTCTGHHHHPDKRTASQLITPYHNQQLICQSQHVTVHTMKAAPTHTHHTAQPIFTTIWGKPTALNRCNTNCGLFHTMHCTNCPLQPLQGCGWLQHQGKGPLVNAEPGSQQHAQQVTCQNTKNSPHHWPSLYNKPTNYAQLTTLSWPLVYNSYWMDCPNR